MTTKECTECKVEKALEEFALHPHGKFGRNPKCKECKNRQAHAYYKNNKEHVKKARKNNRSRQHFRAHKLTEETFFSLLSRQGGTCAICDATEAGGQWNTWHIDHDHSCCPGRRSCGSCVRGILCARCNSGIGFFEDNPTALKKAAKYLEGDRQDEEHAR